MLKNIIETLKTILNSSDFIYGIKLVKIYFTINFFKICNEEITNEFIISLFEDLCKNNKIWNVLKPKFKKCILESRKELINLTKGIYKNYINFETF